MSLRRSARLSSQIQASEPLPPIAASKPDVIKTTKKPTQATKKRKSRASTTTITKVSENIWDAPTNPSNKNPEPSKYSESDPESDPESSLPQTPLPNKRRKSISETTATAIAPFTPTPFGVKLLRSSPPLTDYQAEDREKPRPAAPHATNAPLSTPGGSRVVAYSSSPVKPSPLCPIPESRPRSPTTSLTKKPRKAKETAAPDVGTLLPPTSTTDTLLKDACEHLCKVDPRLKGLIEKHHCEIFSPEGLREVVDPFTALASGIIGQQVSGQAAASIRKKFVSLFPSAPSFPSPSKVIALDIPTLRTAGLSQRKAEYIHGLAEKFASGELSAQMLITASDEDLIEKLVAVRGLGRWSVEMFACFALKRMDVFSTGDLGVQRGMATYIGKDVAKLKGKGGKWKYMTEKEMLDIAAKFSPYRCVARSRMSHIPISFTRLPPSANTK
ncbi:DNA glycosylase [Delitschia confertaspora ATCC 74209]|uniref:DNA glycosylase n=1 Tax=Delitschia confertaspora ATCC 74209 TaxID=1513339 RepID=A0A9P4JMF7_9PLEO|nr:DNA glycosylase [Delitschia confertaspora ATCC 74209]